MNNQTKVESLPPKSLTTDASIDSALVFLSDTLFCEAREKIPRRKMIVSGT